MGSHNSNSKHKNSLQEISFKMLIEAFKLTLKQINKKPKSKTRTISENNKINQFACAIPFNQIRLNKNPIQK